MTIVRFVNNKPIEPDQMKSIKIESPIIQQILRDIQKKLSKPV